MQLNIELPETLDCFLKQSFGYNILKCEQIPSDASARIYYRLIDGAHKTYILMDSSKELFSITPFLSITKLLQKAGLRVPVIIAEDSSKGFLLLEDLGPRKVNTILTPDNQKELYQKMIDLLIKLNDCNKDFILNNSDYKFPQCFISYSVNELNIFTDWYLLLLGKDISLNQKEDFLENWRNTLTSLEPLEEIFVHADFHVDNLIKTANKEIGILDFQDAVIGSPSYDLVSLLQDARRKVKFDFAEHMIEYYLKQTNFNKEIFKAHYHIYGIQRNLRILGVFARKHLRDNNPNYLQYIPLVKDYIKYSLAELNPTPVKFFLDDIKFEL